MTSIHYVICSQVRFLPGVYEILLGDTVNDLVYLLEVQVLKCPFNQVCQLAICLIITRWWLLVSAVG